MTAPSTVTHVARGPVLRLAGLALGLGLVGLLTALLLPVSRRGVQQAIEPFGLLAPLVYVVVAAVLGMAFVPGPLLSAISGVLFGTWLGVGCSVLSAALSAVLSLLVARRAGSAAVDELAAGSRVAALAELARRHGLMAVLLQRLLPGVPDAPVSYAFGALGLTSWQIALGTMIGSAPRAFSYTALGDASVTGDRRLALVAVAVGVAVSLAGTAAGVLVVRRHRRLQPDGHDEARDGHDEAQAGQDDAQAGP